MKNWKLLHFAASRRTAIAITKPRKPNALNNPVGRCHALATTATAIPKPGATQNDYPEPTGSHRCSPRPLRPRGAHIRISHRRAVDHWSGCHWLADRWSAHRWSAHLWSAHSWSARRWSAHRWRAHRWSGHRWPGWPVVPLNAPTSPRIFTIWIPFGDHPLKLERYRED